MTPAIPDHWSEVDPGPLTDDQRHDRVMRIQAEITSEKAWLACVTAECNKRIRLLERRQRAELNRPAQNPRKAS